MHKNLEIIENKKKEIKESEQEIMGVIEKLEEEEILKKSELEKAEEDLSNANIK
jgi:hypothetical protein